MDDDDKKAEDEAAEPAPDAAQEEGAIREVSEDELEQILVAHKTWVETGGEEGSKADLRRANLQKADLWKANLQGAFLRDAKLQEAILASANLRGADLRGANLQGAYLWNAKLQGADLRGADLTKAKNLTRKQLDAACRDGMTKLPDDLADYQMKPCPTPEQPPSN